MLVSFCVIAYNEEKALPMLLDDICKQTYLHEDMEIVLVDSQSTDNTRTIMLEFAEQHKEFRRVVVCNNLKRNQAAGWNVAIGESTGDVIMRIDAHAHIPQEFVENSVKCIRNDEYVVGGPRPSIAEEDSAWQYTLLLAESSMFGSSIATYRRSNHKTYVKSVFHGTYRKEVFDRVGMFNELLGRTEDNEMHYRIIQSGYKICYDPQIVSYQHVRSTWRKMIKQKYGNGYWVGLTLSVCPGCLSIYHFVPLCFFMAVVLSLILVCQNILWPLQLLFGLYGFLNIVMSFFAIVHEKIHWEYMALPIIFLSLHLSYGVGTLMGIVNIPFWRRRIKKETGRNDKVSKI